MVYRRIEKENELLYTVWSLVMVREPYLLAQKAKDANMQTDVGEYNCSYVIDAGSRDIILFTGAEYQYRPPRV